MSALQQLLIGGSSAQPPDPYFANVLALLHFGGANGSQTVIDSSGNSTITVTGTAAITTAKSKFGGSAWKGEAASYLKIAAGASALFAGDFTLEWWAVSTGNVTFNSEDSGSYLYNGEWTGYGGPQLLLSNNAGSSTVFEHHVICRDGSTMRTYKGGVQEDTATYSGNVDLRNTRWGFFEPNGNLYLTTEVDEIRLTDAVCRYPSGTTFTPPAFAFSDS